MSDSNRNPPQLTELLQANEALRSELNAARAQAAALACELERALAGGRADRDSRRAALDLLEDAVGARRTAQRENEERRRVEQTLREVAADKDELLAKLRATEIRQNFLLELTDRLRTLSEPVQILRAAAEMLGRFLDVATTQYALVDADAETVEIVAVFERDMAAAREGGRGRLADVQAFWAEAMRSGVDLFCEDMEESQGIFGEQSLVRSSYALPLVKKGRLVAILTSSHPRPRVWTATERWLVRDIAERTWDAAERALAELALRFSLTVANTARAESDAANRGKDEFLATVSHELRTPMAAILLWAGALRSGAVPMTDLTRALDAIFESAESLSRLIEDLLDLSRLTADKLALSPSPVDLGRVVEAAIEMVRPLAVEKHITIDCEIEEGIGRAVVDHGRLKQIVGNLLTNATKFTPRRGRVVVRLRSHGELFELEVVDNGEGISPEFIPHLFEKFRQADMAETRQHSGLGIGLAVSKQLAELHGGTIEAESDGRGRGATFRVRIPLERRPSSGGDDKAKELPSTGSPLDGVHVLLVEDDIHTRDAMGHMLRQAGARVTTAGTVADALSVELTGDGAPDVIVSDLGLPGAHGLELIERVATECCRQGRRRPAACAVSAHARDSDRKRAIAAGFDMYLTKPVTPAQLVEVVTDLRDIVHSQPD